MKLYNKTVWNTKELRAFFNMISKREGYFPQTIKVVPSRTHMHGLGGIGFGYVKLWIPKTKIKVDIKTKRGRDVELEVLKTGGLRLLARIYIHELGHNLGLDHPEMISIDDINVDFLNGLEIHKN